MAINKDVSVVLKSLSKIPFDESAENIIKYVNALEGVESVSRNVAMSALNLSEAQKETITTMLSAVAASKQLSIENFALKTGADAVAIANASNASVTDMMTDSIIDAAIANGVLKKEQLASVATTNAQTASNTAASISFGSLAASAKAAAVAILTNPMTWITAAPFLIGLVVKAYDWLTVTAEEAKETADELHAAFEETASELESVNSELETSRDRLSELLKLSEAGTITIVEQEELDNLQREIALLEQRERFLKTQKEREAKEANEALETAFSKESFSSDLYTYAMDGLRKEREDLERIRKDWTEDQKARYNEITAYMKQLGELSARGGMDAISGLRTGKSLEYADYIKLLIDRYNELDSIDLSEKTQAGLHEMDALKTRLSELGVSLADYIEQYEGDDEVKAFWQGLADAIDRTINKAEIFAEKMSDLPDVVTNKLTEKGSSGKLTANDVTALAKDYPELQTAMDDSGATAEEVAAHFNSLSVAQNTAADSSKNLASNLSKVSEAATQLQSDYDILDTAQSELSNGGGLSPETIEKLAEAESNYLDYLYEENGVVKLNTKAWKENADAKAQNKIDTSKKDLDVLKVKSAELRANIKYYEEQRRLGNDGGVWTNLIADATLALADNEEAIKSHEKELSIWEAAINGVKNEAEGVVAALSGLSTISGNIDRLSSALGEFSENRTTGIDTLAGLSDTFGSLSSFESFVNIMGDSASSMKDAQEACNKLMSEYIDMCGILDDVNESTAQIIERELEEMGVTNAHELVQARLNAVKLEGVLASKDLSDASWDVAEQILKESGATETAIASLKRLRQEQYNAKVAALDLTTATSGTIGALIQQAQAAGAAASSISALSRLQSLQEGGYSPWAQRGVTQTEYNAMLESARKAAQIDLSDLGSITLPQVKISLPKGSSSGSSAKEIEEYIAVIDEYREAMERLRKVQEARGNIESGIDRADDLKEKIVLEHQLIGAYENEQDALHNLNNMRDATITAGVQSLRDLGFAVQYNADTNELWISNMEHLNELTAASKGKYGSLQEATNALRKDTEDLIGTLTDLNDENRDGSSTWWDLENSIEDAKVAIVDDLKEIVVQASNVVDEIQNVYDTLHDAAEEFASNGGFISVDTLQSIYDLGPQYMQYLEDENGLLVINEERINAVIAAKTEQLALENALAYVERLRLAALGESNESLENLCFATTEATGTTWGLVYAQLEQMRLAGELNDAQYNAAMHNIRAIQSLARNAISGIGRVSNEAKESLTKLKEELETMQDGVEGIIKYVMDMLKHRIQEQIDALEEMKDAYAKIIELRKEALESAKEEADYEDEVASKIKDIAKLQERINALSLDDSRDAQAQKIKLEEEMSELQKELSDTQADYAREAQEEALDDMQEAYEEQKDSEIAALEQTISSYQKLYDMAIDYINQHWQTLYQELIDWNYEYGSVLNQEITDAWAQCEAAAQRYGTSVQSMLAGLKAEISSVTSQLSSMSSGSYSFSGGDTTGGNVIGSSNVDTSVSNADMVRAIVARMKKLSAQWSTFNANDKNNELHRQAAVEAAKLDQYGVHAEYRDSDGTWWITRDDLNPSSIGKLLYSYYHTGGYVDDQAPLSRKEVPAILEKGELVLDAQKEKGLYRLIDFTTALSEKIGKAFSSIDLSSIFDIAKNSDGGIHAPLPSVTNNQNDNVHFGDVYIYGANNETVKQHQEINRKFTNDVLAQLHIKR